MHFYTHFIAEMSNVGLLKKSIINCIKTKFYELCNSFLIWNGRSCSGTLYRTVQIFYMITSLFCYSGKLAMLNP